MGIGVGTVVRIVLSKIGGIPLMGIPTGLTVNGMPVTVQLTISPATLLSLATGGAGGLGGLINGVTSGVGTNLSTSYNGSLNQLFQNPVQAYITEASSAHITAVSAISSYEGGLNITSLSNLLSTVDNNIYHTLKVFEAHTNRISGVAIPDDESQYALTDILNLTSGLDANVASNLNISISDYTNSLNRSEIVSLVQSNLALVSTAIDSGNQNYVDTLVANITLLKSNLDTTVNTDVTNFNKTIIKTDTIGSVQTLAMSYNSSSAARTLIGAVTQVAMNTAIKAVASQLVGAAAGGGVQITEGTVSAPQGFISN